MDSRNRSFFMDALIGAAVSFIFSFIPFSMVLGGAVSGYLHEKDGFKIGVVSGVIAVVPVAVLIFVVVNVGFFGFILSGAPHAGAFGLATVAVLFASVFFGLAFVFLSGVGGYIGEYLATEKNL
ncbi:MAG: DUF5518 domain-containing protein [Halobacteria archaeon]